MAKSPVKTQTRIGKICYTNCLPYYQGLESLAGDPFEFYESYPSKVNLALRTGKIDIGPVSSLEYLNHQDQYLILSDLVIGSRDFSRSVLLFSHDKLENLNQASIALSRESLSSATLLRILLKFKYKFQNKFVSMRPDPERMLEKNQGALVIGDKALFYHPKEFVYKYDLSELWWSWTGKPFCFALWVVRRDFAQEHPEEVVKFCEVLKENRERNLLDLERLIKESLGMDFLDERFPKIFGYLFNLSYGMDEQMQEGLELFYRLATRLKVSPRLKELKFFEGSKG